MPRERLLKAARQKQLVTYKETLISLSADVSAKTLQARREWNNIFKMLKEKNFQLIILYPEKLLFRVKERERIFQTSKS